MSACSQTLGTALQEKPVESYFDGERAFALLKAQCDFGPRYPGSDAHKKMVVWLVAEARKYTEDVTVQSFTHKWSVTQETLSMWNVIAKMDFGKARTILLCAHWDTRPTADEESDPAKAKKPILGANDGASGVAALLELMRVFREKPPNVNILFVFFDGEDLGPSLSEMFLGAKWFAKNLPKPKPEWGILLDMVADKDLRIPKEPNSAYYAPTLLDRFYAHAKAIRLEKYFPNEYGPIIEDDHIPLNRAGIPTIDLIDFDYPYWHTLEDTPDKCSPASLRIVGMAVESFIRLER